MIGTDKQIAAINYIVEKLMNKRCKDILPNFRKDIDIYAVPETVKSDEEARELIMELPGTERKLFLLNCLEACNNFNNGYLLHHALLPVVVGMRLIQDDADRLITNRLIKIEDMFFAQNLLTAVMTDEIWNDKSIGFFLIVGEEYDTLVDDVKSSDRSTLYGYSYIHFEESLDTGEVTITLTYKALEFLFYGISHTLFGEILESLRLSKYDGNLVRLFNVTFKNYRDPFRGGTILEAKYEPCK